MGDDGGTYLNRGTIPNYDQIGARRFEDRVVTDPDLAPDVHTAPAVEPHPPARRTRGVAGQHLEEPVLNSRKKSFPVVFHCLTVV